MPAKAWHIPSAPTRLALPSLTSSGGGSSRAQPSHYAAIRVITFTIQPHYAVILHSHCCCITNWSEPNLGSIQSLFKRGSVQFHRNSTSFSLSSVVTISGIFLNPILTMAEALGIAGSAFGSVSLGLQLFTEISKYLNSVDGRDADLERAKNYARDFQSSLISLQAWASNTGISDANLERAISQGQANCAIAINDLSKMVSDLRGQDTIPSSRTSKARTLIVKLKYPFKKQNLENLEKRLFNTISVLQFALTILQV